MNSLVFELKYEPSKHNVTLFLSIYGCGMSRVLPERALRGPDCMNNVFVGMRGQSQVPKISHFRLLLRLRDGLSKGRAKVLLSSTR
jgi:hypothetical protein